MKLILHNGFIDYYNIFLLILFSKLEDERVKFILKYIFVDYTPCSIEKMWVTFLKFRYITLENGMFVPSLDAPL